MSLTADQFMEIIGSLRSDLSGRRNVEKRAAPRVGMRDRATIIFRPRQPDCSVTVTWVRDVSASGICIVHSEAVPMGTQFIAQFPGRGGQPLSVLYSVAHCKALAKNMYYLGARLVHIFPEMQPQDWRSLVPAVRPENGAAEPDSSPA